MKTLKLLSALCLMLPFFAQAYTSLRVNDPRDGGIWAQGVIDKASVTIEAEGNYLFYDLHLVLSPGDLTGKAEEHDSLEIVCDFDLPAGSFIKSSSLLIEGVWTEGVLMPRKEAHAIYEGVVKRRRDPLIIYKNYGDNYQFKIFPIEVGSTRELKLRYAMPAESAGGNKSAALPWEMLKASATDVALEIIIKKSDDFSAPSFGMDGAEFTEDESGYLTATVPADKTAMMPELASDKPLGAVQFDYSRTDDGIAYRFSFSPDEVFDLDKSKKYLVIIDNDPQVVKDTTYRYLYNSDYSEYTKEIREVYDIKPMPNDMLFKQVQMMLGTSSIKDSFNIVLKNSGVYTYSDTWVPCTSTAITSAVTASLKNTSTYTADLKALLAGAQEWINQEDVLPLVISNNKEFGKNDYSGTQEYAKQIVAEVELNKPIEAMDISSVRFGDEYNRYYYNRLLSYLVQEYSQPTYKYTRRIYSVDDFVTYYTSFRTQNASKIVLLNVESGSNTGIVYDKSVTNPASALPWSTYTEVGKISEGTEFDATVGFRYKGQPYFEKYSFPIGDLKNTMVEDAWAVKLVDALNNSSDPDARAAAEQISEEHHVLTRNTSFLSIDPDAEVTPCYDCPDWQNNRIFMDDVMMLEGNKMLDGDIMVPNVATGVLEENEFDNGISYSSGYRAGAATAESNCITNSADLYNEAYQAGFNKGLAEVELAVATAEIVEFTVAPNPFTVSLDIVVANGGEGQVFIYDAAGKLVLNTIINGSVTLDDADQSFSSLPKGVYVVKVIIGDDEYSTTVSKE